MHAVTWHKLKRGVRRMVVVRIEPGSRGCGAVRMFSRKVDRVSSFCADAEKVRFASKPTAAHAGEFADEAKLWASLVAEALWKSRDH